MKRLRSRLVSSRELLRIAARGSDRRSECRMDEDYIVLHSSDSDGDRRDSESDEAACGSPTRRPMVSDEEAHGSAPRGELTFSDADSDEEARGSSTRGSLSSATLTATRKGADTVATSPSSWTLTVTVVKSQLRHDYTASSSPFPRFRKFDAFPFPLQFRNSARNSGIPRFTIGLYGERVAVGGVMRP